MRQTFLWQAEEDERRKPPDVFLGRGFADAAAGKAASHRKRDGAPLAGDQGGQGDDAADETAGVRAGNQAGEERAFEREIGRVVIEEHARDHTGRERDDQTKGKDQPIGPVPALEDQDVPESPIAGQHRGERGHDGQLPHEGGEQKLPGGEELGFLWH